MQHDLIFSSFCNTSTIYIIDFKNINLGTILDQFIHEAFGENINEDVIMYLDTNTKSTTLGSDKHR